MFSLVNYGYELPPHLVAAHPATRREDARLLVLERATGERKHMRFRDLPGLLGAGDLLVLNDTRVIPARLCGRKASGGRVEFLLLSAPNGSSECVCECLVKGKPRLGSRVCLPGGIEAEVLGYLGPGRARVRLRSERPLAEALEEAGQVPLPPYIRREAEPSDRERYQTVYAEQPGAVAAPTAGLHFSRELLDGLEGRGVEILKVTLHVGYGSFMPLRVQDIREHAIHSEPAEVSPETARRLGEARAAGKRVVAVGTTATRALEWAATEAGAQPRRGECDLYIYPGYRFRVVEALITNFHLPESSLLVLVSAFAGRETILSAYREAIEAGYRFYSYGDSMLIL
jgi:S-adenosylmethionine:tRNA ribosyltransferase-isomerase